MRWWEKRGRDSKERWGEGKGKEKEKETEMKII